MFEVLNNREFSITVELFNYRKPFSQACEMIRLRSRDARYIWCTCYIVPFIAMAFVEWPMIGRLVLAHGTLSLANKNLNSLALTVEIHLTRTSSI